MSKPLFGMAITTACVVIIAYTSIARRRARRDSNDVSGTRRIREALPRDLESWRLAEVGEGGEAALWAPLRDFFSERGYTFWRPVDVTLNMMVLDLAADVVGNGFGYATTVRGMETAYTPFRKMYRFWYPHPLMQAAQAADGRSVIIRVLATGNSGREHVEILELIARGSLSLITYNHATPLLELLHFEDVTFGVFPKIGGNVREVYGYWAEDSVGDILDIFMQCLEALGYIHSHRIAHRDAFKDNFLVQFHPETLQTGMIPISRPRVYLNDFECAVSFPPDAAEEDCVCTGYPLGSSFLHSDGYKRPVPPEVAAGQPYNAFKLDVWQLATSFAEFKCDIPEIDDIIARMRDPNSALRPRAYDTLLVIATIVQATPPQALFYPPRIVCGEGDTAPVADVPPATISKHTLPAPQVDPQDTHQVLGSTLVDPSPPPTLALSDVSSNPIPVPSEASPASDIVSL